MATYSLYIDKLFKIWNRERIDVTATSFEEAVKKAIDFGEQGWSADNGVASDNETEYLYDTEVRLRKHENDNNPTIEIYEDSTDRLIYSDVDGRREHEIQMAAQDVIADCGDQHDYEFSSAGNASKFICSKCGHEKFI